jgi:phosphate transport system substrate-binding protein
LTGGAEAGAATKACGAGPWRRPESSKEEITLMRDRSRRIVAASALTLAVAIAGAGAALAQEPVVGNVDIHGSSTVAPISNAVAEAFNALNPDFTYVVGDEGTGAGFADFFCPGISDISDASRQIKDEEATTCAGNGVEYVELKVAYDGLAVITSAANTTIDCLSFADLYALLGPEANTAGPDGGQITNWSQAQALATELGSTTTFPDAPLVITAPGTESGTYDSFIELVIAGIAEERGQEATLRDPGDIYVASPSDNVIIQGVAGTGELTTTLGFVGLAYAEQNKDTVKMLGVDGGEGCVTPDTTTVSDGSYPIARPLFIYPNLTKLAENSAITPFVDYYLSDEGISHVASAFGFDDAGNPIGYVAMPAEELQATRDAWTAAKGG